MVAMRNVMRNWMLGTALVAGLFGTGAVAANAAPQEFRGRTEQRFDRDRGFDRRYDRGYDRRFERPVVRGYEQPGYGVVVGDSYAEGYIPPCPGEGYDWIGGAWVFRGRPEVAFGYGYGRNERFDRGFDRGRGFDRRSARGADRGFDRNGRGRR
jgi:hypothetical protein